MRPDEMGGLGVQTKTTSLMISMTTEYGNRYRTSDVVRIAPNRRYARKGMRVSFLKRYISKKYRFKNDTCRKTYLER